MLSFELSAIDLILMIAVIVILILYITKLSAKPSTEEKISVREEVPPTKLAATESPEVEEKKQTDSLNCPYGFGYLKKLDRNATIPDKCLSCPKIMECFGSTE